MNAIRVRKKTDSDTLHIPELRSMIGRDVEIIVLEDQPAATPSPLDRVGSQAFWGGKTLDELAAEQGGGGPSTRSSRPYPRSSPPKTSKDSRSSRKNGAESDRET